MGNLLYREWLDEEKIDPKELLILAGTSGITGVLIAFEMWLERNNYIVKEED